MTTEHKQMNEGGIASATCPDYPSIAQPAQT